MIEWPVRFVAQTRDDLCWAASTAMLVNYRGGTSKSDLDIAAEAGVPHEAGMTEIDFENVARQFELDQVYPQCADALGWEESIRATGPVAAVVARGAIQHIIVISGAAASSETGGGEIYVLDPFHGEGWMPIEEFQTQYDTAGQRWSRVTYRT